MIGMIAIEGVGTPRIHNDNSPSDGVGVGVAAGVGVGVGVAAGVCVGVGAGVAAGGGVGVEVACLTKHSLPPDSPSVADPRGVLIFLPPSARWGWG